MDAAETKARTEFMERFSKFTEDKNVVGKARKADGKVTPKEANELLAQAKKEFVQGGELSLLRQLAGDKTLAPSAKDAFVKKVAQKGPSGAPLTRVARMPPKMPKMSA